MHDEYDSARFFLPLDPAFLGVLADFFGSDRRLEPFDGVLESKFEWGSGSGGNFRVNFF